MFNIDGGWSSAVRLDRLGSDMLATRARLDRVSEQISSGRKGSTFGALGPEAQRSVELRVEIGRRETRAAGIRQVEARVGVMQTSLNRLGAIADQMRVDANVLLGGNPQNVDAIAAQARDLLREVQGLLNTTDGSNYLFSGTDNGNQPVPDDILTSGLVTQIETEVAGLAPGGAATILANSLTLAQSDATGTTPFSDFLSTPVASGGGLDEARVAVPVGDARAISYGIRANSNAAAVSPGAPDSTGSWARDLIRGLAILGSLTQAQSDTMHTDVRALADGVRVASEAVVDTLADERGILGTVEARLATERRQHDDVLALAERQLSDVEEIDIAEASTRLSLLQTQLEASYRLVGQLGQLSLANYL